MLLTVCLAGEGAALFPLHAFRSRPARGGLAPVDAQPATPSLSRVSFLAHLSLAFDEAERREPGHHARVALVAQLLARRLDLSRQQQQRLAEVALLHGGADLVRVPEPGASLEAALTAVASDLLDGQAPTFVAELDAGIAPLEAVDTRSLGMEAATLVAAHWTEDASGGLASPLLARRRLLDRAADLEETLGPQFAAAVVDLVRSDAPWAALADPTLHARLAGDGDARPLADLALAAGRLIDRTRPDPGRAWRVSALAREMAILAELPDATVEEVRVAASLLGASRLAGDETQSGGLARISTALLVEGIPGCEVLAGWLDALERTDLTRLDGEGDHERLPLEASILGAADFYCTLRAGGAPERASDAVRLVEAEGGWALDPRATRLLRPAIERLARQRRRGGVSRRG